MAVETPATESLGHFRIERRVPIAELQCELVELVHVPTGARVMHVANEDPENVFCISFQTCPDSSNGVAHILEHTVLCGSDKFPVRDPFFSMNRRSLNTFMNAFTGSDFTCYPAASQVEKDFYNLFEVYLDAVFHPKLDERSFRQEGHRLEFSQADDPTSPLEYKGIVFNEMKGCLSSPERRLWEAIGTRLFPDVTYGVNSGGEPRDIPSLSYQQLLDFHATYYHPSRAIFYFYGNLPLEQHLSFLEEQLLHNVEKQPPLPPVPLQPRFTQPRRDEQSYPIAEDEDLTDKGLLAMAWLTCPIEDQSTVLGLAVLDLLLTGTDAAPLKKALLRSGLVKTAGVYLDEEIREVPLILIAKDCDPDRTSEIETLVTETLEACAESGFDVERVEAALHQLEFDRCEITGDGHPYGLMLFMRAGLLRQHGVDPEKGLEIHRLFKELRERCSEPSYLPGLIRRYLLENPHRVSITMRPDPQLAQQEKQEEADVLSKIQAELDDAAAQRLVTDAAALETFQAEQENEDIEVLPKVELSDVPERGPQYPLVQETVDGIELQHHETFTNQVCYVDLVFDLPDIAEEDLPYARLFAMLLPNMGCGGRDYAETLEYLEAHTGGASAALSLNMHADDPSRFEPAFQIKSKALNRKLDKLFPVLRDMIASPDFSDTARIKELLTKHFSGLQSSLTNAPLRYAINLSASRLNVAGRINMAWYGLEYYEAIKDLYENFELRAHELTEKLNAMKEQLLSLQNMTLVTSCDAAAYAQIKQEGLPLLRSLPAGTHAAWQADYAVHDVEPQARVIAAPVAFSSQVFPTVPYVHPDSALIAVASNLMDNKTLHKRIREQGGAYGGGSTSNSMSGNFTFYSYRDPNIAATFAAFEESVRSVIDGNFSDRDLEDAKLEVVQRLDSPLAPGSRGITGYALEREGRTPAVRQAYRERLLSCTREEVIAAVRQHIAQAMDDAVPVVFAGKDLVESENSKLDKPLAVKKI